MKYMKLGSKPDSFQTDGEDIRFVATELASDITVTVGTVKFYLHKFPLLSKSALLQRLVSTANDECASDEISLPDVPGGSTVFEMCAKFCYGMTVTLNAYNVVVVRCAAEYLEMHEAMEKGNLIYKIDVFLNSSVLRNWKDSIIVLQSTRSLLPWSEDLKVISRCVESIATKASIDTDKVDWSYTYNRKKLPSENRLLDTNWNGVVKQQIVPSDWWVEDLCDLDIEFYKRVIVAIKARGDVSDSSHKVIGEALKAYTYKRLSSLSKALMTAHGNDNMKNRSLVETIVRLLPREVCSVSCSFLIKLLRTAKILDCDETCKKELVVRIGLQLEEASVNDLLILTSDSDGNTTVSDIDTVLDIVEEFVSQEEHGIEITDDEVHEIKPTSFVPNTSKISVANLIDGYLAEIAKDPNLPLSKFAFLAQMISDISRPLHDALYHAIDTYLMEHPTLSKQEKKKLCSLMDCKKLSMDARTHAVQNDRLPLRVIVQVLYFEQVRSVLASGSGTDLSLHSSRDHHHSLLQHMNGGSSGSSRSAATTEDDWDASVRNGNDLRLLKSMRVVGESETTYGNADVHRISCDSKGSSKVKGIMMPKKMFSRLWSSKSSSHHRLENGSSDNTSDSPGSTNNEESKSTFSVNTRRSVS